MKTRPGSASLTALRLAIAITCLAACSGGPGGCSGSRGCGGCQGGDRNERKEDDGKRQTTNASGSAAATHAAAHPAILPTGPHPALVFRVWIDGRPADVEALGDIRYVRLAFEGSVDLEIDIETPTPTRRLFLCDASNGSLREPTSTVIEIDDHEQLVILAEPIEPDAGALPEGSPDAGPDSAAFSCLLLVEDVYQSK